MAFVCQCYNVLALTCPFHGDVQCWPTVGPRDPDFDPTDYGPEHAAEEAAEAAKKRATGTNAEAKEAKKRATEAKKRGMGTNAEAAEDKQTAEATGTNAEATEEATEQTATKRAAEAGADRGDHGASRQRGDREEGGQGRGQLVTPPLAPPAAALPPAG